MADTTALKNRIRAAIKANDNQEITGPVLQQALLDMVDELNGATETEAGQRQNGDSTLSGMINSETQRAQQVEGGLSQRITQENQRAQTAEQNLQQNIDKILLKRSVTPPSSSTFWAFNNVLKGKTGWIRILNASTAQLHDGDTYISRANFYSGNFVYYDFSALTRPQFYTVAADVSKDVVLEFFDEPSILKYILENKDNIAQINTILNALGVRITEENQRAQTAEQNLQQNIDKILLKRSVTPPSSSTFWAFNNVLKGKTGWIRILNASTAQLHDGDTYISRANFYSGNFVYYDFSALTRPQFYTVAADVSKDVVLEFFDEPSILKYILENKDNIAQINTILNALGVRMDEAEASIDGINGHLGVKTNFISNLPETFGSGNEGTHPRHNWNFDLSFVRQMLDIFGVFTVFMEITASAERAQDNGALYCNSSTRKKNISFHEEDGVLTTGLVKITFTEDDYEYAVEHLSDFPFFWQWSGGGSNTFSVVQAYYYISNIITADDLDKIVKTFEIDFRGYSSMTALSVKKDGSGDFTTVQDAINSIEDASVIKQYVIDVYDDFDVKDLTQLWKVSSPKTKNTSAEPTDDIALVILKDWIHIRGIGSPKRLYVESPNVDMAGSAFQHIQTIYPKGNCTIENFYVGIQGGRYAIHQEASGSTNSPDYHATTHYKDLVVEHKGNYMYTNGGSWSSTMAQANGTAPGLKVIYENVKWISDCRIPFYTHTNLQNNSKNYDEPNEVTFINCSMVTNKNVSLSDFSPYWGDIGSGKITRIKMIGCNFTKFNVGLGGSRGLETTVLKKDVESGGAKVTGNGNTPMVVFTNNYINCLSFKTVGVSQNIDVVGGSAYDLIWGATIKKFDGTNDFVAKVVGKRFISNAETWASNTPSQVYTLAHLLGNCASNPKTLIVKVGNTEYTINLNKNYVTSDGSDYTPTTVPAYSNSQIITDINSQFPDVFVCERNYYEMYSFDDCQEIAVNRTTETINVGDAVCRDYANGFNAWRLANSGEKAEGIAGCRINPSVNEYDNVGNIILINKAIFGNNLIGIPENAEVGSTFILGNGRRKNWYQGTGNKATFVVISSGYCKYIK